MTVLTFFFYSVFLAILIFLIPSWYQKRRVLQWRARLSLDKHEHVHRQLYTNVDAFALSRKARLSGDSLDYVYGESHLEAFIAVLSLCRPSRETVFYDLGSGVGKLVTACAMVFDIEKSCGIELFPLLHDCAKEQVSKLRLRKEYHDQMNKVSLRLGDLRDHTFEDATVIFINASAFFGECWLEMSAHIASQIEPGSLVISTSKQVASADFLIIKTTKMRMSWGVVQAFIQRKRERRCLDSYS